MVISLVNQKKVTAIILYAFIIILIMFSVCWSQSSEDPKQESNGLVARQLLSLKLRPIYKQISLRSQSSEDHGLVARHFRWDYAAVDNAYFSYTFYNSLKEPVVEAFWRIVFYDSEGKPVDTKYRTMDFLINPEMAKRIFGGSCHGSVIEFTKEVEIEIYKYTTESEHDRAWREKEKEMGDKGKKETDDLEGITFIK